MAAIDEPQVGQIVDHHFLWTEEQAAGRVEGFLGKHLAATNPR